MSISSFFHDISDFLSGISLDEDAQGVVDEVKATSEAIREHNESNVTGQGSTLPTPHEPFDDVDSNESEEEEDNDSSSLPENSIPVDNPQDGICTSNPDALSCDKEITNAYFAKKSKKRVPSDKVGTYTFNKTHTLLKDNKAGRQKVVDDILKYLVKNKLGSKYANETTKANIESALPYKKLGRDVPITFNIYNSETQETTSHSTIIKNRAGRYDGRETIPTKDMEKVVTYIVKHIKTPNDGNKYVTTKENVKEALTKKVYAGGDVVEHIKLQRVIDDYTQITKANLGSKVYLVAEIKNFRKGTSVTFKMYESGDKLLKDYVTETGELPFLLGTNEKTEVTGEVVTADVDNPETGNILEGRVAIEIALRPKKDKPTNKNDTDTNFEDWKKKFKKLETDTKDKEDKLYLKVSSTSYPDIGEVEFLVGDELVVKYNGCLTLAQLTSIFPNADATRREEVLNVFNEYCNDFQINTPLRVAHFFAQVKEEVGSTITYQTENLNYAATALGQIFSYFRRHPDEAILYGRTRLHPANQEAIANRVYANRIGNGNIASGDGWRFRGKGFIQLTGRANYQSANDEIQRYASRSGIDIIQNPESILTIEGAMVSSMGYWIGHNLNNIADNAGWNRENVDNITDVVNSGTDSREDRKEHFDAIKDILNIEE